MVKKSCSLFFIPLLLIFFCPYVYAVNADVEHIPTHQYLETVLNQIQNAKASIEVYMYVFSVFSDTKNSETQLLLQGLTEAKRRGVEVKVVLDHNIDFNDEGIPNPLPDFKNTSAYALLKQNGISVFFDDPAVYTHAKVIVIDKETVIIGSHNWTRAALTRNNEASVLVRSKEYATKLLSELHQIKLQAPSDISNENVIIPWSFINNKDLLGDMVTSSDERSFDVYLWLLKEYNGNEKSEIILPFPKLAESLGMAAMENQDLRRQIIKVLDKLKEKYKLIDYSIPKKGKDAVVILKNPRDVTKNYLIPSNEIARLPAAYWDYGWNKTLSFSAKAMLLINYAYAPLFESSPSWYMSRESLSKKHGISVSFITDGTSELKKLNLLDIKPGELDSKSFSERKANIYTPKEIYNPKELEEKIKALEEKYGPEKLKRARENAAIVFEAYNLHTIDRLITLENEFGQEVIQKAASKMKQMKSDNPKLNAGYFINTIKSMAGEKAA